MNKTYKDQERLRQDLAIALEEKQFHLVYQPKINLASGKIIGMEALLRWKHPKKGLISPMDFIPAAEETGLVLPIGEWVLREACMQNKRWQDMGLEPFIIAVNLSVRQLYQAELIENVKSILQESGLSPKYVEFEITENIMMDVQYTLPVIKELKSLGVRLSLDDFGTGYSSLSYLTEFPFDEIKIDRSFLFSHHMKVKDETLVKAIIAMAQQLNMTVVAEGVETVEQLVFLQQNKCDKAQGYFFSRPLLPNEIIQDFDKIEDVIRRNEVQQQIEEQNHLTKELENAQKTLEETVRKQQGMIFKFIKRKETFIHTIADGELLYKLNLTPELLIGRSLYEVLPIDMAEEKLRYYEKAWAGEENVTYESELNGVHYFTSLQPVWKGGRVVEVIGSAVNITKRIESEELLQKIAEYTLTGVLIYRGEEIVHANPAARSILGHHIIGKSINQYRLPNCPMKFPLEILPENARQYSMIETCFQLENQEIIEVEMMLTAITYEGAPAVLVLFGDETKRKVAERIFEESRKELEDVNFALNESAIVAITDRTGKIQFVNEKFSEISKYEKSELIGQDHYLLNSGHHSKAFFKEMWGTIGRGSIWRGEIRNRAKDGSYYWVDTTIVPFLNEKNIPYQYVSIRTDITERKKMEEALRISEEKLKYIAFHDALTEIPNRRFFLKKLEGKIQSAKEKHEKFAIVYLDMDSFKNINDTFGHDVGDEALKEFVQKVKSCISSEVFFARQGGDEFMLLIPIDTGEEVGVLLESIVKTLQKPSKIGQKLHASLGVAIYPTDGLTKDQLMKHADEALYQAKKAGKNKYYMYSERI